MRQNFLLVLLQLFYVAVLITEPTDGKQYVIVIMQIVLLLTGLRYLLFYFTMARYMVDGKAILYRGAIYLDLGIFLGMMTMMPSAYFMIYVVGYFAMSGVYRCLKLLDAKKMDDSKWFRFAVIALWYLALAVIGIINLRSETVMVELFCVEMTLSAIARFVRTCRKTAVVYYQ